jgi:branched-subunit amino acid transport protein
MSIFLMIVGMGLVTFCLRLSFLALSGRWQLPLLLQRALYFVPVSILVALIVPDLIFIAGSYDWSLSNGRVVAAGLAALVAWRFKNVLLTLGVGMGLLYTFQALFG